MKTLIDAIKEVEANHFRTNQDTGAHSNAMLIMNTFRRIAGLPYISKDDLPKWCDINKKYLIPHNSKLLTNE